MRHSRLLVILLLATDPLAPYRAQTLDPAMHHLRHGPEREWAEFPERAEGDQLRLAFAGRATDAEQTLRLRHRDLRHPWKVLLNGREIARLPAEDNATVSLIPVPRGLLRDGANEVAVACAASNPEADDVAIGDIALLDKPRAALLAESSMDVTVTDADTSKPIPCRLTIVDSQGSLVPLGLESAGPLAVRPGVVYTATGRATLRLPAGQYTLHATRGFEWGLASATLDLRPGDNPARHLRIRREVDTRGLVACDTHVHTFTHSRHGDATLVERMITLAGEGVELPIATDHNLPVDYDEAARAAGVRPYFTPVVGNEVTTPKLGHFNVFPVDRAKPMIDFRAGSWEKLFASIDATAPGAIVVLNHARDLHGGYRPFDPIRHVSVTGERLDGQLLRATAMEVINSGATLNDPLLLYRDWVGCLNRGVRLTPVGASDSHDVTRFIVGQGRTYAAVPGDTDTGKLDVTAALDSFRQGRVSVSYGLLTTIKVNGRAGPGDTLRADGEVDVEVAVHGPSWTRADRVELHANGVKIREALIPTDHAARAGLKASHAWRLPRFRHDVHLTAVAVGPGVTAPYWPAAKPYQRTNPHWTPYVWACTGAVGLDADNSGTFESAHAYAQRVLSNAKSDPAAVMTALAEYDAAVAAQAASILRVGDRVASPDALDDWSRRAPSPAVREGFTAFSDAWRASRSVAPPVPAR
jgi:hypothetical protein